MPFIPETFYAKDRKEVKVGLSPLQLAYVEKLEDALKAADAYRDATYSRALTPEQDALDTTFLIALSDVNFLKEEEHIATEENELPCDVIFQ